MSLPTLFKSEGFYPPMVSYAQNFEDVTLRRAFASQPTGFYIDIGAYHPVSHSVTHHFYLQGWCGVNVEANPALFTTFLEQRARDSNVCGAIGATSEENTPLYIIGNTGLTTTKSSVARAHEPTFGTANVARVPMITLNELITTQAASTTIDFLKVDVEGAEYDVLASCDYKRFRPRVILFECNSIDRIHELLTIHSYSFAWFDGLNLFYVRNEDISLLPLLARPPQHMGQHYPTSKVIS